MKPEQIVDYLALVGDTSDNIPGVKKWVRNRGQLVNRTNDIDTSLKRQMNSKARLENIYVPALSN